MSPEELERIFRWSQARFQSMGSPSCRLSLARHMEIFTQNMCIIRTLVENGGIGEAIVPEKMRDGLASLRSFPKKGPSSWQPDPTYFRYLLQPQKPTSLKFTPLRWVLAAVSFLRLHPILEGSRTLGDCSWEIRDLPSVKSSDSVFYPYPC